MGQITTDLRHAIDVADAWLKGGDRFDLGRRSDECVDTRGALAMAIFALDARLDALEDRLDRIAE